MTSAPNTTPAFKNQMLALEKEVWNALSTSKTTTHLTRHNPNNIDPKRFAPYLRDDMIMLLPEFPVWSGKKTVVESCGLAKPYTMYDIDESTFEVRVVSGKEGNEKSALLTYKCKESSGKGVSESTRFTVWSRSETDGEWYVVSHATHIHGGLSREQIQQMHWTPQAQAL
eukprot:TRINITY_DN9873_c0_g1_i1.p1 TRINITY_DN9873_c0_g1~~TRINITY_DN9873_c0_g1_i1.p1  ORF type:complete len:170 (+),score=28.47 TRINITY_DN9873_c0_g1_i1:69-578(+)